LDRNELKLHLLSKFWSRLPTPNATEILSVVSDIRQTSPGCVRFMLLLQIMHTKFRLSPFIVELFRTDKDISYKLSYAYETNLDRLSRYYSVRRDRKQHLLTPNEAHCVISGKCSFLSHLVLTTVRRSTACRPHACGAQICNPSPVRLILKDDKLLADY
jgi:hypothetical protein